MSHRLIEFVPRVAHGDTERLDHLAVVDDELEESEGVGEAAEGLDDRGLGRAGPDLLGRPARC